MSSVRARAMQIEAISAANVRELEWLVTELADAPSLALEGARMALDDARSLLERSHYVRRQVEAIGPDIPPAA